ncbi:MAG: glycine cleavage system aminomethyltransferase GcvT [Rhodobacteraceae bacterium]|nr:glycine cleavage system aminomethyltransferase GcvT [Paracoccaceae bacterium]
MAEPAPLYLADLHTALGAKFVPFAGYAMPVHYRTGVMAEHLWCREQAGLFDVSHMGQVLLPADQAAGLERLVPVDVIDLPVGRQRYGVFTNDRGGVLDDLMIARRAGDLLLVVNAACTAGDIAHLARHLTGVAPVSHRALLALQGPLAERALARLLPDVAGMRFMDAAVMPWTGDELWIARSGYTGEDGFEISVHTTGARGLAQVLLDMDEVAPIGLGARDSLRLEAGLPLYGHDLGPDITPIEAGLGWAISRARRTGGARAGGYPGAGVLQAQAVRGAPRRRVGLRPQGRVPMRAGVPLFDAVAGGARIGHVTSGGFGPSVGGPISMGLIRADIPTDAPLYGEVRGKRLPAAQTPLPFQPQNCKR